MRSKTFSAIGIISLVLIYASVVAQVADSCVKRHDTIYVRNNSRSIVVRYDTVKVVECLNRKADLIEDTLEQIKKQLKPDDK